MARVTIEDCLEKVEDRFELVGLASQRARDIASGSNLTIERNGEKDTVIALREIAEGTVSVEELRDEYISSFEVEKNSSLEGYIVAANEDSTGNSSDSRADSLSIDEEEADIRAAIAEAAEVDQASEAFDDAPEGYSFDDVAEADIESEEEIDSSEE